MASPVSYDLQGQGGGEVLNAGGGTIAALRWIQCITDCVFASISSPNLASPDDLTGITIPAGVGIGGLFESVELSSGVAIVYYA
jgi:hypothetical protein